MLTINLFTTLRYRYSPLFPRVPRFSIILPSCMCNSISTSLSAFILFNVSSYIARNNKRDCYNCHCCHIQAPLLLPFPLLSFSFFIIPLFQLSPLPSDFELFPTWVPIMRFTMSIIIIFVIFDSFTRVQFLYNTSADPDDRRTIVRWLCLFMRTTG